jgi:hypothetical protein
VDVPRVVCASAAGSLFFLLALIRGLRIERTRALRHATLVRLGARSSTSMAPRWVVRLAWLGALALVSVGVALLYWRAWGTLPV